MADVITAVNANSGVSIKYPVAEATSEVLYTEERRELPRALMGGTDVMRAAGRKFAPQHPAEDTQSYETRIGATTLYGVFAETVRRLAAKFFTKPIVLTDKVPPAIKDLMTDIDGENTALDPFMMRVVEEGFGDGISYVLVDFPKVAPGATLADQQQMKARPYWVRISACKVLGWKTEVVGGQRVLSQFRYIEEADTADGEYDENLVPRIRVLKRGGFEVWERRTNNGVSEWVLIEQGTVTWEDILVVPVYINRRGFFSGLPPLRSLAELCQEHWVSSSEQRHALTMLRFAMLCVSGLKDPANTPDIVIGADRIIKLPQGGEAKFIEHNGAGLSAGDTDIKNIEARMKAAGMELRVENQGEVTATAAAIDSQESNAGLKAVGKSIEEAVNTLFKFTGQIMGIADAGTVEVFDEFAESVETTDVPQLISMYNTGVISRPTLWKELKRRHVLDDDFDPDEEEKLMSLEGPRLTPGVGGLGIGAPSAAGPGGGTPPKGLPPTKGGTITP